MIKLKPGQPDPEMQAFQKYNLADGPPPLSDLEVQLNKLLVDKQITNPEQRAAALDAIERRDRRAYNQIMWAKTWDPAPAIKDEEIAGYAKRINLIPIEATRNAAHAALEKGERELVNTLLEEKG
jgi:hypothetical protein